MFELKQVNLGGGDDVSTLIYKLFRGVTGTIEIKDGQAPNTSIFHFVGCFDNIAPACMIRFILKVIVLGKPLCKKAATEFKREGAFPTKYTGPKPPP